MTEEKKAVLTVSFGTGCREAGERTIGAVEREIREQFAGCEFCRAWTSRTIGRMLKERDGTDVEQVDEALERLLADGYRSVTVPVTFVIRGREYDRLMQTVRSYQGRFDRLVCGEPLLTDGRDFREVVAVMEKELAPYRREDTVIVLMGHGTEHVANFSYERLQQAFHDCSLTDFVVGTVEESPTKQNMLRLVEEKKPWRVVLAPFLLTAGEHVRHDIAGAQPDSWKSRFLAAGYQVECVTKGLGEYAGIREIYARHAREAEERNMAEAGVQSADGALPYGVLCGIGVGPGDPELLTQKAIRRMRECDVLMVPTEDYRSSIAWQIAVRAVPELEKKPCVGVAIPMVRDAQERHAAHGAAALRVMELLEQGMDVGFLNLGDVTLYASYLYIHRLVSAGGYRTELVNGVPSFCAAAAALGVSLAEDAEELHILSQPEQIREGLGLPGTKVVMKSGKHFQRVKDAILKEGRDAMLVENCGLPGEKLCRSLKDLEGEPGYYSLLIIKDR
ncbi:MAG: precorrin-2 C(20)-methyltransferase [Clostridiales bacterium]|nr:precorrin-2 C(20)-methyltransferase [Clostridiales bacterium]